MLRGLLTICLGLIVSQTSVSRAEDWAVEKSKHFLVYHQGSPAKAREVAKVAEGLYVSITKSLGVKRYDNFWLWDDRAKVYLYPSHEAYVKGTQAPAWSAGKAVYSAREIHSFVGSGTFVSDILPHEMTHLIFREATEDGVVVPLWVQEGIAQWHEPSKRKAYVIAQKILVRRNVLMTLESLGKVDVRKVEGHGAAKAFYTQAIGVTAFMIESWGEDKFATFCRALREGKGLDAALAFTYGARCPNLETLESAWKTGLLEN